MQKKYVLSAFISVLFGALITNAFLSLSYQASDAESSITFALAISDNAGKSKNGATLLTLKFETGTPSPTTIIAKNGTPTIDGQDGDTEWGPASTVSLDLSVLTPPSGPAEATVKAAYDSENIYFLVKWVDPTGTKSIHKSMWTYNGTDWIRSKENEDRVYFLWNINAPDFESGCTVYCHFGEEWTADTKMGTNNPGDVIDVWHWKATRTNPLNHAEDKHWVDLTNADEIVYDSEVELRTRIADQGGGFTIDNKNEATGLPLYMHPSDPGANADFLFQGSTESFDPAADWENGDTIPGYVLKEATGSRADVETVGVYSNGIWTVEFKRALHTGNPDDVSFMTLYAAALEGKVSEQQGTISSLEGQVANLEDQVTDLEERVSGLESTMYLYLAGGVIGGLTVGAIIVYAIKRKPT